MPESSNPEKCRGDPLGDPERRPNKTRAWMIDALSMAAALLAVFHYKPEGMVATVIVFAGAYCVANALHHLLWPLLPVLLGGLSVLIYLCTISVASRAGVPAMVLAMFLPVIAQAYWIWALWAATGTLFHLLPVLCAAWLILLGILCAEHIRPLASARIKLRHQRD